VPAVKVTKAVTCCNDVETPASGGIVTRRQESWASNPRMTETVCSVPRHIPTQEPMEPPIV
jgi:hypothetical protein